VDPKVQKLQATGAPIFEHLKKISCLTVSQLNRHFLTHFRGLLIGEMLHNLALLQPKSTMNYKRKATTNKKKQRLSNEEYNRRVLTGLCLRSGKKGHLVREFKDGVKTEGASKPMFKRTGIKLRIS
jgi:hypothetical protein